MSVQCRGLRGKPNPMKAACSYGLQKAESCDSWQHRALSDVLPPPRMKSSIRIVDVDRLETWSKYKTGMCDSCAANCCTMPLEVRLPDLVRLELVDPFEVENIEPKLIAKRLLKMRLIDHFNPKHEIFTMARRAGGDCNFLDKNTRRCTVYEKRPETCRLHPKKGPKPGFCAYGNKALTSL